MAMIQPINFSNLNIREKYEKLISSQRFSTFAVRICDEFWRNRENINFPQH